MRRNDTTVLIVNVILFSVVGVIMLGVYFISRRRQRLRTEAFGHVAAELGLDFTPEVGESYVETLDHFDLFSKGRAKKAANLIHGTSHDRGLAIFDYRYTTGSGKHAHTWHTTVFQVQFDGPALPRFSLRAENLLDKIASKFGSHDIDFDSHPQFSRKYLLRGENEPEVRSVFTVPILEYFEARPGLNIEAWEQTLLFYRLGKRVKPEEINNFLADGLTLLALFNRA